MPALPVIMTKQIMSSQCKICIWFEVLGPLVIQLLASLQNQWTLLLVSIFVFVKRRLIAAVMLNISVCESSCKFFASRRVCLSHWYFMELCNKSEWNELFTCHWKTFWEFHLIIMQNSKVWQNSFVTLKLFARSKAVTYYYSYAISFATTSSGFSRWLCWLLGIFGSFAGRFWRLRSSFLLLLLRTWLLVTVCCFTVWSIAPFPSVKRCWISTTPRSCHFSFATSYRTSTVWSPFSKTSIDRHTRVGVTIFFFLIRAFARSTSENRRWVITLSCSNLLSSIARLVTNRKWSPVGVFSIYGANCQEARFGVFIWTKAITVFAVSSRRGIATRAIPHLDAFPACLRTICPSWPFGITSIGCCLGKTVISSYENTAKNERESEGR